MSGNQVINTSHLHCRCFHSLKSLLLAQNVLRPNIVYMKHSMLCEQLATSLFKEFSGTDPSNSSGKQDPILLILDRRLDPVTPFLNQVEPFKSINQGPSKTGSFPQVKMTNNGL
jgi:hypothetical protein